MNKTGVGDSSIKVRACRRSIIFFVFIKLPHINSLLNACWKVWCHEKYVVNSFLYASVYEMQVFLYINFCKIETSKYFIEALLRVSAISCAFLEPQQHFTFGKLKFSVHFHGVAYFEKFLLSLVVKA